MIWILSLSSVAFYSSNQKRIPVNSALTRDISSQNAHGTLFSELRILYAKILQSITFLRSDLAACLADSGCNVKTALKRENRTNNRKVKCFIADFRSQTSEVVEDTI